QDSLNSAVGGNFLDKMPRDFLSIIVSKYKVRYSRDKPVVARVSMDVSTSGVLPDVAELKDLVRALLLNKKATDGNVYRENIQEYVSQASAVNYNQRNTTYRPQMMSNQIRPPGFPLVPNNQNVQRNNQNCFIPNQNRVQSKPVTFEPAIAPVSASKPNPKALIPNPSRRSDERNREKANNQIEKFYQIFKDTSFKISFVDALILIPKFASTLKALIGNKEKLSEMARTPLNEQCSVVLLKKLPKKLGDPGKFLIPCDFPGIAECLALADLGASINLMPLSVWKKLPLPDLTSMCMTLELSNCSISRPVGVAEDVYVKVGLFHFSIDFVVVDFDADPWVSLIIERSFFKTERALINVFEGPQSRQDKDKDEGPSAGLDRGLKNRKTRKDVEPTTSPKNIDSTSRSSKGTKSQPKSFGKSVYAEEPEFEVGYIDTPQGQEGNLGNDDVEPRKESASRRPAFRPLKGTRSNYAKLEYEFKECYKAFSKNLDWENPEGGNYLFDLFKPLPLITRGNHQSVLVEFFINNNLKYLQGGILTMAYTASTTKIKVTRYGYLEEIMVRRAENVLYKFKEGDFPRLRINDIEDTLLLVVQNRLTNLLGDDVANFAIALRMFTRSLVIQKRVEDLQLRVESYQKQINITKLDTTRPYLSKRHSYTPYKDPQGFIYVDDYQRNRLIRSHKLYKFSDGTSTR
nr:reverse transcriptase domain-containing protein [Tanacetum cinerariifolium]